MTVIAVPQAPAIICPSWCVVPRQDHLDELPGAEGFVIHWSDEVRLDGPGYAALLLTTSHDGTTKPGESLVVSIDDLPSEGTRFEGRHAVVRRDPRAGRGGQRMSTTTTAAINIVCPDWCVVTSQHAEEDGSGVLMHWAEKLTVPGQSGLVSIQQTTYPDGTPTDSVQPTLLVDLPLIRDASLADARKFANALLRLVDGIDR